MRLRPRHLLLVVAAVGGIALSAPAFAHGTIDLEPIEARVAAKLADGATPPKDKKAYKALSKVLAKHSDEVLSKDIAKLRAVAAAVKGKLAADLTLRALLANAIDGADAKLIGEPDEISEELGLVGKLKDRTKFEKQAAGAYTKWLDGRTDRSDAGRTLKQFFKAAKAYETVHKSAAKSAVKNPAPKMTPAEPQKVYTVAGNGEPGYNGDDRDARRSSLYFVDECAFGPDGKLYILDWNNHMVRRVAADGTLEHICGSGVPGDSEGDPETMALNHPSSLAFDTDTTNPRVFIAAWHNHKVKVYDPLSSLRPGGPGPWTYTISGTIQGNLGADGTPATDARYNLCPGVLRLPNGDLLSIDAANAVIRRVELSNPFPATNVAGVTVQTGNISRFAGTTGSEATVNDLNPVDRLAGKLKFSKAQNAEPDGRMQRDGNGNIYVVNGVLNVIRKIAMDGTMSTFAGTGVAGFSGDGGLATSAQLNGPSDIAVAADGTVYISDSNNHCIRVVVPNGTISTFAGEPGVAGTPQDGVGLTGATGTHFNRPAGLELDANGNLYVCDRYNSVIRVITTAATNIMVPVAPYTLPVPARGGPPAKGAADVIDTFAGSGTLGFNGDGKALDTDLYWPQDVAVDPSMGPGGGEVYFLDWNNHRVRKVGVDGNVTTVAGSGQLGDTVGDASDVRLNHPTDIAFHPVDGALWIAAWHTDKILRLDSGTHTVAIMAGGGRGFAGDGTVTAPLTTVFNICSSVKFSSTGRWYVGDEGNRRVREVVPAGEVTGDVTTQKGTINTIVGTGVANPLNDDGPGAAANLDFPVGQSAQPGGRVCLSPDDNYLFIADTNHNRVRMVDLRDANRRITTVAGNGTAGFSGDGGLATNAQLNAPVDVDCDAEGNLYIADRDNNAIRKVTLYSGGAPVGTPTIQTLAGQGPDPDTGEGYSGDKGPAVAAKLRQPSGLFVVRSGATAGRIYVADTYNGVIRVIWEADQP